MNRQSAGNQIESVYIQTKSILQTAKTLDLPYKKIHNYLVRHTDYVSSRKKPVKISYNKEYFKKIDSSDKAYFLGLIKADGYIDKLRNRLAIRLQEKDIEILKHFCDVLNFPHNRLNKIKSRSPNQQDHIELSITNKEFIAPILEVKTSKIFKDIPEEFSYDFIRGYFDGDGTIAYRNLKKLYFSIAIVGSPLDDHMLQYIMDRVDGFTKIYLDKRSNLPFIKSDNQKVIRKFRDLIYSNCYIYLTRKKIKFDQFTLLFEASTTTRKTSDSSDEDIV